VILPMRSPLCTLALCALFAVISGGSLATPGPAPGDNKISVVARTDTLEPWQLTDEENQQLEDAFKENDKNSDGFHQLAEIVETLISQARATMIEGFNRADSNSDGSVDQAEFLKFFPGKQTVDFKETDTDNNGKHSLDEQLAHYNAGPAYQHDKESAVKTAKAILRVDDKDGDGQLSKEEFMAHSGKALLAVQNEVAFNHADKDRDGLHTVDEIVEEIMRVGGFKKSKDGRFVETGFEDAFHAADLDGDGSVTRAEFLKAWPNATAAHFVRGDANKDGKTTLAEVMAYQSEHLKETYREAQKEAERHIKAADANGDGRLDLKEKNRAVSMSTRDSHFRSTDMDGDGFHTQGEIMEEIVRSAGYSPLVDGKNAPPKGKLEQRFYLPTDFLQAFLAADKNGDEVVTKDEFLAAFGKDKEIEFEEHDTDGDGRHSLDEQAQKIFESEAFKKLHVDAEKLSARHIKDADKDGDGKISKAEFNNHVHNDTENEL